MKTVVILGSARHHGNTAKMVELLSSDLSVEVVNLLDYNIHPYSYDETNLDDDFIPLMERLLRMYDRFIFATPVYWYTMSALMKIFFDRQSDLVRVRKDLGRQWAGKNMAVLSCGHGQQLNPYFNKPFELSAAYLKANFEDSVYTWTDGNTIEKQVKENIAAFALRLKADNQ